MWAKDILETKDENKTLVVLFHCYLANPNKMMPVIHSVKKQMPATDIYAPKMPLGMLSFAKPEEITNDILLKLDSIIVDKQNKTDGQGYDKIIFVGHSFGALIARQLYVRCCAIESQHNQLLFPWSSSIDRVILFAAMNRGWRISHHLSIANAISWSIGSVISRFIALFKRKLPIIYTIRKGAPFITKLRIDWIHMRNAAEQLDAGHALTIQLLGTIDDMVSPKDNVDLVAGRDFIYMDVPHSGHASVIELEDKKYGIERQNVFVKALIEDKHILEQESQIPADSSVEDKNEEITDVIFVMHGIRDLGYWTHRIARRIIKRSQQLELDKKVIATETSSYGYFPMLSFIFPFKRLQKVAWLMDQYAEALAKYPRAKFSFIGHSNGTYLLAKALTDYPLCKFKNVAFAGSVVRRDYNWQQVIERGQVENVLNYAATTDYIVGIFPNTIQKLKLQDLGSAGHNGFISTHPNLTQIKYITGAHSAALNELNWNSIADFILTGKVSEPPKEIVEKRHTFITKYLAMFSPLVIATIFVGIAKLYWIIYTSNGLTDVVKTLLLLTITFTLYKVLSKL